MIARANRLDDLLGGGQEKKDRKRELIFQSAASIRPRPVRWVWDTAPDAAPQSREGRFPLGSLVLAVGRAGVGKSQFAAWLVARITTGTLPGEFFGSPRAVIYAATEDSWEMTIVPRLIAAGADLENVFRISVIDDGDAHARLTLPSDTAMLEKGIGSHDVGLVVMDPLLSLIDSSINDYRAREVREALEPLVEVADRTKVVLLGLAHFTKATGNDPLMLVSGSAAFGQLVRSAVAFARDEDEDSEDENPDSANRYVCSTIKNNLGREDLPSLAYEIEPSKVDTPDGDAWVSRLRFTGQASDRSVRDILRRGGMSPDPEETSDRKTAAKWLRDYLTLYSKASSADIKKAARGVGFTERTLQRARSQLKVEIKNEGFPSMTYWSLPATKPVVPPPTSDAQGGTTGGTVTELHERRKRPWNSPPVVPVVPRAECGTTGTTGDRARSKPTTQRNNGQACAQCGRGFDEVPAMVDSNLCAGCWSAS